MRRATLLLIFTALCLASAVAQKGRPVAAVIAFDAQGVSRADANTLADLFSYNLTRDGRLIVVGRQESSRIVDSLDMPPMDRSSESYFFYIGDFLYADLLFAGKVEGDGYELVWKVSAYAPDSKKLVAESEFRADSMAGLYRACPDAVNALLAAVPARFDRDLVQKYETALAPFTVKQRILFVFPDGVFDTETALARETMYSLFAGAVKADDILPVFIELAWDIADEAAVHAASLAKRYDVHRVFYIALDDETPIVKAVDSSGGPLATFRTGALPPGDADAALAALRQKLPPLSQETVARELVLINEVNEKLSSIIAERRILSKPFSLNISQKMIKTVGHPSFQPTFDFIGIDASFFWYYNKLLGAGAGYGFSAGYPGTLDDRINGHPLFLQHEIRLYPISLRLPGKTGIVANGFVSFNTHNASKVTFHLGEETTYSDPMMIYYSRIGAELCYFLNLSETTALSLNLLSLTYCIPISMGPNFQNDRSFCGDIGGVGIIIRF
jgi:hypothetical protein